MRQSDRRKKKLLKRVDSSPLFLFGLFRTFYVRKTVDFPLHQVYNVENKGGKRNENKRI